MSNRLYRSGRRGMGFLMPLTIFPTLGTSALVLDIGSAEVAKSELQAVVDAATLAGAGHLDGTEEGFYRAKAAVRDIAALNEVRGKPVYLDESDVTFGHMENGKVVRATTVDEVDGLNVDTNVPGGIATMIANIAFGHDHIGVRARAGGLKPQEYGAGVVECYLPIALPDCILEEEGVEDLVLRTSSANDDNVAWAALDTSPSASQIVAQLINPCREPASINNGVGLNNGTVTPAFAELAEQIKISPAHWDRDRWGNPPEQYSESALGDNYGKVIEGPIMLFDAEEEGGSCGADVQFNGIQQVTGFAWGVIYDVQTHGTDKHMRVKVDLTWEYPFGVAPGGLATNVIYRGPATLVD